MPVALSSMPKRYSMLLQHIFEKNGAAVQNQFDRGQRCSWCGRYEEPSGAVLLWLWHSVLWRRMIDLPSEFKHQFCWGLAIIFHVLQKGTKRQECKWAIKSSAKKVPRSIQTIQQASVWCCISCFVAGLSRSGCSTPGLAREGDEAPGTAPAMKPAMPCGDSDV